MPLITMKRFFLLLALVASVFSVFAQEYPNAKVEWGPEENHNREFLKGVLGTYADYTYTLWITRNSYRIQKLDRKLNMVKEASFDLEYNGKSMVYQFATVHGDEIRVFTSFWNRKTKKNFLLEQSIDPITLSASKPMESIGSIATQNNRFTLHLGGHSSTVVTGDFGYNVSRDQNKLMVFYENPDAKPGYEGFTFQVFDKNFKKEWEKTVELPYVNEMFTVYGLQVDNAGNIHISGREYLPGNRNGRRGSRNFNYRVISWYQDSDRVTDYKVALPSEKLIRDMQFAFNDKGHLICSGFYSNGSVAGIKGAYFMRIDPKENKVLSRSVKEFDFEFITQDMNERQKERAARREANGKDVNLFEYDLDEIVIREDGGAVLIGEQYYVEEVERSRYNPSTETWTETTTYHYYYNDIIVVNISPEGEIEWNLRIPKYQHSINDNGFRSSYHLMVVENQMCFLFYDDDDNFDVPIDEEPGRSSYESLALVALDLSGDSKKYKLIAEEEIELRFIPKYFERLSDKEVLLYGFQGGFLGFGRQQYQFSRLVFE